MRTQENGNISALVLDIITICSGLTNCLHDCTWLWTRILCFKQNWIRWHPLVTFVGDVFYPPVLDFDYGMQNNSSYGMKMKQFSETLRIDKYMNDFSGKQNFDTV